MENQQTSMSGQYPDLRFPTVSVRSRRRIAWMSGNAAPVAAPAR